MRFGASIELAGKTATGFEVPAPVVVRLGSTGGDGGRSKRPVNAAYGELAPRLARVLSSISSSS